MSQVAISGNVSGTGTLTIASPNTNSNYTLTLPQTTATLNINGPAFSAYASANQTFTNGVFAKVQINTEEFDTNSNYDTANYRFTPTVAGYYQVSAQTNATSSGGTLTRIIPAIYKNGSAFKYGPDTTVTTASRGAMSCLVYLNGSTDYIEYYALLGGTGTLNMMANAIVDNYFQASMVRGA